MPDRALAVENVSLQPSDYKNPDQQDDESADPWAKKRLFGLWAV
jgi:hypothetical protein